VFQPEMPGRTVHCFSLLATLALRYADDLQARDLDEPACSLDRRKGCGAWPAIRSRRHGRRRLAATWSAPGNTIPKWLVMTVAIAGWLREQAGLPIHFQFQPQTFTNKHHSGTRHAIGMRYASRRKQG